MGGRPQKGFARRLAPTESDDDMDAVPSSEENREGGSTTDENPPPPTSEPESDGGSSASEHEEDRKRRREGKKVRPLTQKRLNKMRWSKQVRRLQRAEQVCMSKLSFAR